MNASFRTAFWAMCLGLTVPMVLFIGVEVMSPGSATRKTAANAADRKDSLQARLQAAVAKPATSRSQNAELDRRTDSTRASGNAWSKTTTGSVPETLPGVAAAGGPPDSESAEPQVVLGPDLEPEQVTSDSEPGSDRRVPAIAAHTRPRVRILPDIEPVPSSSGSRTSAAIEDRLAGIQSNLDKIGRTLDAQQRDQMLRDGAQREPPVDPVKQVSELLKQLQEARQRDQPSSQLEEPAARKPADENRDTDVVQKGTASVPQDAARDAAPHDAETRDAERRPQAVTRIYRPRFLSGSALQSLVEPLLTRDLGKTGAADAETGEPGPGNSGNSSGSPANALVVHDLPQVMRKIDLLLAKLDVPPTQVAIEAVVITLQLNAGVPQGIDLRAFNATGQSFAISPVDAEAASLATGGLPLTGGFGLKCGVLTGDPQAFISALETAAHKRSARAWQMSVVNRQSAVLMLNDPFGSAGPGSEFSAGTILKIRPVVDRSGLVQLDVRRDVDLEMTASGSRAAALTNQIALHDGQTAVVGGFFAEQTALHVYSPSGLGKLPLVGGLFRKQFEAVELCETIVLLTPRVVAAGADADSQVVRKQPPSPTNADTTLRASHTVPAGDAGRGRK